MLTRAHVEAAAARIEGRVRRTPVLALADGEAAPNGHVTLKCEFMQHTGSFKARGAFNRLLKLDPAVKQVLAVSGGNHGAAVAYAASQLGMDAEVFVPSFAPAAKLKRIEGFGGKVKVIDGDFGAVVAAAREKAAAESLPLIHAFDDLDVIEGQGACTLEFAQQAEFDTVLIAVGGGGLAGGAVAALNGAAKVVAVETEGTATYHNAVQAGRPAPTKVSGISADSLGANEIGANTFALLSAAGAASLLVRDDDVLAAQKWLWSSLRIATEAGGATALAALRSGAYQPRTGERVGVIVCGANTDLAWVS